MIASTKLDRKTTVASFIAIWAFGFLVSLASYVFHTGQLPTGFDEWFGYPLFTSPFSLAGSFGKSIRTLVFFLPAQGAIVLACGALIFWPFQAFCTFKAIKTGSKTWLALVAAQVFAATLFWHTSAIAMKGI